MPGDGREWLYWWTLFRCPQRVCPLARGFYLFPKTIQVLIPVVSGKIHAAWDRRLGSTRGGRLFWGLHGRREVCRGLSGDGCKCLIARSCALWIARFHISPRGGLPSLRQSTPL